MPYLFTFKFFHSEELMSKDKWENRIIASKKLSSNFASNVKGI